MSYVTLDEAKIHCRVDYSDDDSYISDLIEVCETAVADEIGSTLASTEISGVLPRPLKQCILLLIGHLYNNREPVSFGSSVVEVPYTYKYLLNPYKTWTAK